MLRKHSPKFHIVGSESELDNVRKLAKELKTDNVVFYGQRPLNEMPRLYKIADVMLVTLEDKPYANMTIPVKVQSNMAVGKCVEGVVYHKNQYLNVLTKKTSKKMHIMLKSK